MKIDGKHVVDAKRRLLLKIMRSDIKAAQIKSPKACVAAQACVRRPEVQEARVHLSRVYLKTKKGRGFQWTRFITPGPLKQEIIAYDRGGSFEPGTYELLVPQTVWRSTGTKPQNYFERKLSTPMTGKKMHYTKGVREPALHGAR